MKTTNIEKFHKLTAKIKGMEKTIQTYSEYTADTLKEKPKWKRNRSTRTYNSGWKYDMVYWSKTEISGWVHNQTDWQLTWLLENGHLVTNKKGGVGWAAPHPHIRPVFDEESKNFVDDMRKLEIEVDIN